MSKKMLVFKGVAMIAAGVTAGALSFKPILKRLGYSEKKAVKDSPIEDVAPIDEGISGGIED